MLRILSLLFALGSSLIATTQSKPIFRSQTYAGILESESGTGLHVQTINGVGFNNWFGGIGTGIDWAGERTIPLFISVNKFLGSAKLPLYFTADLGTNFIWLHKSRRYFRDPGEYEGGIYWAGGVGWRFQMKSNNNAVLLNFGYNAKRYTNRYETTSPCLVPPCPVDKTTYDYRLRRLSLRVGWMF